MSWRIIVASDDAAQGIELKKGAERVAACIEEAGKRAEVLMAKSAAEINGLLRGSGMDLVIATARLPEHPSAPASQNDAGLKLIQSIQSQTRPPPCILVSECSEHADMASSLPRCRWLEVGLNTEYDADCVALARQMNIVPSIAHSNRADFALIEIEVPDETRMSTIKCEIHVDDRANSGRAKLLGLNQKKVDELVEKSRKLSERFAKAFKSAKAYANWQTDYRALGESFYKLLDTEEFKEQYNRIKGALDARRDLNFRLRFNLGRTVFDGLWESMCKPASDPLMLEATITRRQIVDMTSFDDPPRGPVGTLNVLVIASTLDDNSRPKGPTDLLWQKVWGKCVLHSLPHIDNEVAALKAFDNSRYDVKVDVLSVADRPDSKEWSLADLVQERLTRYPNQYDVVHFAGHALFAPTKKKPTKNIRGHQRKEVLEDDRGFLVFSGVPHPEAISIATVADWLDRSSVALVYLSCCRSSASRAAAEFARRNIRTTLGFSWDLEDEKAVDFTLQFYEKLLSNELNVCSALSQARGHLHSKYRYGNPIWASPVLLAQPTYWRHVEGVLRPPLRQP
ncbi:CHAT domain-containing protein [Bradyrhizobium liaoningense]|uniref:CHAT domain-containing protein n=1 Tax=Bradyrhizobium liaoningense TaxID=43992 RepID=UPI001BA701B6|nr:CHAT domain-containing protein [Bradyrhizobium liaoningense]MBR1167493.1 CHAT domain-containing protein [Bradyrhizobium liaoningense]